MTRNNIIRVVEKAEQSRWAASELATWNSDCLIAWDHIAGRLGVAIDGLKDAEKISMQNFQFVSRPRQTTVEAEDLELQQAVEASFATSMPKSATPCYIASREPKLCYGFCLVSDVLSTDACAEVYEACQRAEREMLAFDPDRVGNRDRGIHIWGAGGDFVRGHHCCCCC